MKLVTSITPADDANRLIDVLIDQEFRVTRINTAGGFLKRGNATIVIGVDDDRLDELLRVIRDTVTHVTVYVLDVLRNERL